METREELIKQAVEGDPHAFSRLYEEIYQDLYRYAYYMLQNRQDAEDAVSEGVLAAYRGIRKLKSAESFRSWMFQIVTNICKRKRKEYLTKHGELQEIAVEWEQDADEMLDVRKALQLLTEEERQIVGMSVLGGYTSDEIGRDMKLKAATVRSKLSRSLGKLRSVLCAAEE